MRTFILLIIVFFCSSQVFAGDIKDSSVPAKVKMYVTNHFPKASGIEWDFKKDDNLYEAEFRIDGLEYKLKITPEGLLHASKEDVKIELLPKAAVDYIRKEYAGYKILGANKKVKSGKTVYDVGVKGKNSLGHTRHYNLYFDENGKFISVG